MFFFSCFKKKEYKEIDDMFDDIRKQGRRIYNTHIDSVYSLQKRIHNKEIEETDFDTEYLKENEEYLVEHKNDIHYRYILLNTIFLYIDYDSSMGEINTQIEDMRTYLYKSLKNLPTYLTQNSYMLNKKQLKKIIMNEIHIDNVKLLIELL